MTRAYGDFQTPPELVDLVLESLEPLDRWRRFLEPTCGVGNFVDAVRRRSSTVSDLRGVELQRAHVESARARFSHDPSIQIIHADAFSFRYADLAWNSSGPLLVVGNLPWVTNSELGGLARVNIPVKSNPKGLQGLDAITGSANFDIAEFIWLTLIDQLRSLKPTIALLCKTTVARNVLDFGYRSRLPIRTAVIRRLDAKRWFNASVDACLFCVEIGNPPFDYRSTVYPSLDAKQPESVLGFVRDQLVSDIGAISDLQSVIGQSPIEWRQGLKHDAAQVMELEPASDGSWRNKLGRTVTVEDAYIYPLLKGTPLFRGLPASQAVIVPQTHPRDDTRVLAHQAPRLWSYLSEHANTFAARRSSIYRSAPPFAIFGVGPYSFAPYKVCISGFHKEVRFRAVGPVNGRPVMLDDTCYFLPCRSPEEAALIVSIFNTEEARRLIAGLVFSDSKRPITKKLLQRVDFLRLIDYLDSGSIRDTAKIQLRVLDASVGEVDVESISEAILGPLFVRG
jgi:hypothetical protein